METLSNVLHAWFDSGQSIELNIHSFETKCDLITSEVLPEFLLPETVMGD